MEVVALPGELATCAVDFLARRRSLEDRADGEFGIIQWRRKQAGLHVQRPIETKTGVLRVVTHNIQDQDARLIAVDREGKERLSVRRSGNGAGGFSQMVREFDIRPDQVKEFRLQTRPFEEIAIKDVALKPREGP